jgi:hypothetical protein
MSLNRSLRWSRSSHLTVVLLSAVVLVSCGTVLIAAPPAEAAAEEAGTDAANGKLLLNVLSALVGGAEDTKPVDLAGSTHKQIGDIKIRGERSGHQLQSFAVNSDGQIFAVVGPSRPYGNVKLEGKNNSSEIRVFDGAGKDLRQWTVDFAVQSISIAPNGQVFVSGNGKIAKFDAAGKELAKADLPHVAKLLKNSDKLKEEAEAQLEADKELYAEQLKQMTEQVDAQKKLLAEHKEKLEAKPEEERTAAAKRQIRTLEMTVKNLESNNKSLMTFYKQRGERKIDDVINELTGRLKITNALTVSDNDVFIASGVMKGYGYAIWRTSLEFEGAEQIVSGLSGCCGQMDIRCCEDGIFVAENSRKRVVQYDRDGKQLRHWGEGDRNRGTGAKFGGCCNPMNLCFGSNGEVLTAESEGYIKRFTKEGSFLGIVGQAKVSGGCKNVTINLSPNGEKAYFFDLQGSRIVILNQKPDDETPAEETTTDAKPDKKVSKAK